MFLIFRFSLAHKLSCHRVPLDHRSPRSPSLHTRVRSLTLLHLSANLNMRWRFGGSPGKHGLAKLFTRVGYMIEECAWHCQRITPFSPPMEAISWFVYTLRCAPHRLVKFEHKFEHVDAQCLNRIFTEFLGKQCGWKWKVWQCLLEFDDENKHWQIILSADNHCPSFFVLPLNKSLFRQPL